MIGTKVFVYRNLHKKCYSVKCMKTKRVIAHVDSIELIGAVFKVSEAGRQRVLREKRKNVHAGVVGIWSHTGFICTDAVTYSPYLFDSFVYKNNELPVYSATIARLDSNGIMIYN